MSAHNIRYLVDTNALSQLGRVRRGSKFFRQNARIPSAVLRESEGFPDIEELRQCEYPTTPTVLLQLIQVMAGVEVSDTKLVDLYSNRGSADPLLIACALDAQQVEEHYLIVFEWTIVTGDRAVRAKARQFGLSVLDAGALATLVDASHAS